MEIRFVEWCVRPEENSQLPRLVIKFKLDNNNKIWEHSYYFRDMTEARTENCFRSIIYDMIIDRDHQFNQSDEEWTKSAKVSDIILGELQEDVHKLWTFEKTMEEFWKDWQDFSFS